MVSRMSELTKYTGSCHCGRVRFEASADLTGELVTCNCSICSRTGAIMAFIPGAQFELVAGDDALTDYQFNKKQIHHLFCSTCGVRPFARGATPDGGEMVALNVRCIEGLDLRALRTTSYDGRSV